MMKMAAALTLASATDDARRGVVRARARERLHSMRSPLSPLLPSIPRSILFPSSQFALHSELYLSHEVGSSCEPAETEDDDTGASSTARAKQTCLSIAVDRETLLACAPGSALLTHSLLAASGRNARGDCDVAIDIV
jgi:hypothetical protein